MNISAPYVTCIKGAANISHDFLESYDDKKESVIPFPFQLPSSFLFASYLYVIAHINPVTF